jgi:hypothetical protein
MFGNRYKLKYAVHANPGQYELYLTCSDPFRKHPAVEIATSEPFLVHDAFFPVLPRPATLLDVSDRSAFLEFVSTECPVELEPPEFPVRVHNAIFDGGSIIGHIQSSMQRNIPPDRMVCPFRYPLENVCVDKRVLAMMRRGVEDLARAGFLGCGWEEELGNSNLATASMILHKWPDQERQVPVQKIIREAMHRSLQQNLAEVKAELTESSRRRTVRYLKSFMRGVGVLVSMFVAILFLGHHLVGKWGQYTQGGFISFIIMSAKAYTMFGLIDVSSTISSTVFQLAAQLRGERRERQKVFESLEASTPESLDMALAPILYPHASKEIIQQLERELVLRLKSSGL